MIDPDLHTLTNITQGHDDMMMDITDPSALLLPGDTLGPLQEPADDDADPPGRPTRTRKKRQIDDVYDADEAVQKFEDIVKPIEPPAPKKVGRPRKVIKEPMLVRDVVPQPLPNDGSTTTIMPGHPPVLLMNEEESELDLELLNGPAPFICKHCHEALISKPLLQEHLNNVHSPTASATMTSKSTIPGKKNGDTLVVNRDANGQLLCPAPGCNFSSKQKTTWHSHVVSKNHGNTPVPSIKVKVIPKGRDDTYKTKPEDQHKCEKCGELLPTRTLLYEHNRSFHAAKITVSLLPTSSIPGKVAGDRLMARRDDRGLFTCPVVGCPFETNQYMSWRSHVRAKDHSEFTHVLESCIPDGKRDVSKFHCQPCDKVFADQNRLTEHNKNFHAPKCSVKLTLRSRIPDRQEGDTMTAERDSNGNIPCPVPGCDFSTNAQSTWSTHVTTANHTVDTIDDTMTPAEVVEVKTRVAAALVCSKCGISVSTRQQLYEHTRAYHSSQITVTLNESSRIPGKRIGDILAAVRDQNNFFMCPVLGCPFSTIQYQSWRFHVRSVDHMKYARVDGSIRPECDVAMVQHKAETKTLQLTNGTFRCGLCGVVFPSKEEQVIHHSNYHSRFVTVKLTGDTIPGMKAGDIVRVMRGRDLMFPCPAKGCRYKTELKAEWYSHVTTVVHTPPKKGSNAGAESVSFIESNGGTVIPAGFEVDKEFFVCDKCGETLPTRQHLYEHNRSYHALKITVTLHLGASIPGKKPGDKISAIRGPTGTFHCPVVGCSFETVQYQSFRTHVRSKSHKEFTEVNEDQFIDDKFKKNDPDDLVCHECNREMTSQHQLNDHIHNYHAKQASATLTNRSKIPTRKGGDVITAVRDEETGMVRCPVPKCKFETAAKTSWHSHIVNTSHEKYRIPEGCSRPAELYDTWYIVDDHYSLLVCHQCGIAVPYSNFKEHTQAHGWEIPEFYGGITDSGVPLVWDAQKFLSETMIPEMDTVNSKKYYPEPVKGVDVTTHIYCYLCREYFKQDRQFDDHLKQKHPDTKVEKVTMSYQQVFDKGNLTRVNDVVAFLDIKKSKKKKGAA